MKSDMIVNNLKLSQRERDADFDLKEEEADELLKQYHRLSGHLDYFMAMCGQCEDIMPFELDEGVCMKCGCDPVEGIVEDMNEDELGRLLDNNLYHIRISWLWRKVFEDLPSLVKRQHNYRCVVAREHFKTKNK